MTNSDIETCITGYPEGSQSAGDACRYCLALNENSTWEECRNDSGLINYLSFYYCGVLGRAGGAIILLTWLAILFYLMSYFLPTLSRLSKRLRLSNNIIGLLFVAVGNGAPDFFSGFSAIVHGSPVLGVSILVGGSLFIITIVWAIVTLIRPAKLPRRPYLRDIVLLLATSGLLFAFVMDKKIEAWEAGVLAASYVLYVVSVLVLRWLYQRRKQKRREELGIVEDTDEDLFSLPEQPPQLDDILFVTNIRSWKSSQYAYSGSLRFSPEEGRAKQYWYRLLGIIGWQEKSLAEKLLFVIVGPADLLRNLTIPLVREGSWYKGFAILNPILAPLFVLATIKQFGAAIPITSSFSLPVWSICLAAGLILSIAIFFTTGRKDPPKFFAPFIVGALLMSGFWLYIVSTELVGVLRTFCRIAGVGNEMAGLSLLSWGNSVSDIVTNSLLAKQGWTDTAIAACLGGATFNLLFGVGLACLVRISLTHSPVHVDFEVNSKITNLKLSLVAAFGWMVFVALLSGLALPCFGFQTPKKYAVALCLIYSLFFIFTIVNEAGVIPIKQWQ